MKPLGDLRAKIASLTTRSDVSLQADTEIYRDLGIYGGDLYALSAWIADTFEVDFSAMNVDDYGPSDGVDLISLLTAGLWQRKYKSLTIGDLERAIAKRKWDNQSTVSSAKSCPSVSDKRQPW
jgi:hypothetical protein